LQEIARQQIGDKRLSCGEIEDQVYAMEQIMQESGMDMSKEEIFIHVTEASRQIGATAAAKTDHTIIPYASSTASFNDLPRIVPSRPPSFAKSMAIPLLLLVCTLGWHSPTHAGNDLEEGEIRYVVSGGIAGRVYTNLTITPEGIAINKKHAPPIKKRLTPEEYRDIRSKVEKLFAAPSSGKDGKRRVIIYDSINHRLQMKIGGEIKERRTSRGFGSLLPELSALAKQMEEENAPWKDLKVAFRIDKDVYFQSDSIFLSCLIRNPTDQERSVFFRNDEWITVIATKGTCQGCGPVYTPGNLQRISAVRTAPRKGLQEIKIDPGRMLEVKYKWDMTYREKGRNDPLHIPFGRFTLSARLVDTALKASEELKFDLTEPDSFLVGEIVPDDDGAKPDSDSYRFRIKATNWSNKPQEIAFPYDEDLDIDLQQGVVRPRWQPLKYATPAKTEKRSHRVVLAPGESRIFERKIAKKEIGLFPSSLGPGYTEEVRFHALLILKSKSISLSRDGTLPISPHRDSPQPAMVAKIGTSPEAQGYIKINDTNWRCLGSACETPCKSDRPAVEICRALQEKVGKVKSFEHDGVALGASELAMCNQNR
jgi:hypothetical protein